MDEYSNYDEGWGEPTEQDRINWREAADYDQDDGRDRIDEYAEPGAGAAHGPPDWEFYLSQRPELADLLGIPPAHLAEWDVTWLAASVARHLDNLRVEKAHLASMYAAAERYRRADRPVYDAAVFEAQQRTIRQQELYLWALIPFWMDRAPEFAP